VKRDEKKRVKMTDDKGFFGLSVGHDVVSHEGGRIRHITTRLRPLHLQEISPRNCWPQFVARFEVQRAVTMNCSVPSVGREKFKHYFYPARANMAQSI